MTNPTNPDDELAINIGNLYMHNNNKFKTEMVIAVEAVFDAQKEKDIQELAQLQKQADDKKKEADTAQKQADQRAEEFKRKYGSM
ncbi:unnamed protein product [Adineta steineri]|uniref:Uncharacterized protein n=1 Tax=Adineta steineri TaxID=433720 RepID=A0A813YQP2_9BILA|nr:unnamed protein product [Adineta steineri]CAF0983283.1 unnamed protein product [Adineta steineri]